jgi:hypothetical protein
MVIIDVCLLAYTHYSGVFDSIGNTFAALSGTFAPVVTGVILGNQSVSIAEDWQN